MDGVLIDSGQLHWHAWQLLAKENSSFKMSRAQFENSFGKTNEMILQALLPSASFKERKRFADRKEALLREIAVGKITLLPGMESFLKEVCAKKLSHIIASSTPVINLEFYLEKTPLGEYFNAFTSAEQVPRGKPFPDVFIEAARRIGLPPKECIVLEDAPAGLKAGRDAGCFVVALATSHPAKNLSNYDLIYPSARQLDLDTLLAAWKSWRNGK